MKAFLCLAVSTLLIGLLYMYVRQQVSTLNAQHEQIMAMIKALASEIKPKFPVLIAEADDEDDEDDEADEAAEADDEDDEDEDDDEDDEDDDPALYKTIILDEITAKDAKDAKDSKDAKDAKDSKDAKDTKDAKDAKDSKEVEDPIFEIFKADSFRAPKFEEIDIICNSQLHLICVSDDSASEDSDDETPAVINLDPIQVETLPTRVIEIPTNYDAMTVKELKEVVASLGGPNLKTKKPMLDYIKAHNKILE